MPPHSPPPPLCLSLPPSLESNVILFFSSCSFLPSLPPSCAQPLRSVFPPIPSNHSPPAKKPNSLPSSSFPSSAATARRGSGRTDGRTDRRTTCLAGCPPARLACAFLPPSLPPSAVYTLHGRRRRPLCSLRLLLSLLLRRRRRRRMKILEFIFSAINSSRSSGGGRGGAYTEEEEGRRERGGEAEATVGTDETT